MNVRFAIQNLWMCSLFLGVNWPIICKHRLGIEDKKRGGVITPNDICLQS